MRETASPATDADIRDGATADRDRAWPARPLLPCAWGDVFDRYTILALKRARIAEPSRLANVAREHAGVAAVVGDIARFPAELTALLSELAAVNASLWGIEEDKRSCIRAERFDERFLLLARAVADENDRRARIKKRIDILLGSEVVGEKSYVEDD